MKTKERGSLYIFRAINNRTASPSKHRDHGHAGPSWHRLASEPPSDRHAQRQREDLELETGLAERGPETLTEGRSWLTLSMPRSFGADQRRPRSAVVRLRADEHHGCRGCIAFSWLTTTVEQERRWEARGRGGGLDVPERKNGKVKDASCRDRVHRPPPPA